LVYGVLANLVTTNKTFQDFVISHYVEPNSLKF